VAAADATAVELLSRALHTAHNELMISPSARARRRTAVPSALAGSTNLGPEREHFAFLKASGASQEECIAMLPASARTLRRWQSIPSITLAVEHFERHRQFAATRHQLTRMNKAVDRLEEIISAPTTARSVGTQLKTIRDIYGVVIVEPPLRGNISMMRPELRRLAHRLAAGTASQDQLARQFRVSTRTIRYWSKRSDTRYLVRLIRSQHSRLLQSYHLELQELALAKLEEILDLPIERYPRVIRRAILQTLEITRDPPVSKQLCWTPPSLEDRLRKELSVQLLNDGLPVGEGS
jgi:hypothetical protein